VSHEQQTHRLLTELAAGNGVSQRHLSAQLGVALGLTNLLIRNLVRKGWVRVTHAHPTRVRYLLTPRGLAQQARLTRAYLGRSVRFYAETRDRIRERLAVLSATGPWEPADGPAAPAQKRIVFYGAGEVAEIGYLCLQGTDLALVGVVVDDSTDGSTDGFLGVRSYPLTELTSHALADQPYDVVVVMAFLGVEKIRRRLEKRQLPAARVFWI